MLYFGTDGIRAHQNSLFFTDNSLHLLGKALALWNQSKNNRSLRVLGIHDTRGSAKRILHAITQGLHNHNHQVFDGGVLPTPAAHWIMETENFDFAIILTASHNPADDNGIKILIPKDKITLEDEATIERHFTTLFLRTTKSQLPQKVSSLPHDFMQEAKQRYLTSFNQKTPLPCLFNKKIVIDCAHGAMSTVAQELFSSTNAQIILINAEPNGTNINQNCGATAPENLIKAIQQNKADLGIAFDGDGDRVVAATKDGQLKTGDDLLCIISQHTNLKHATHIIGTIMTNEGFNSYLKNKQKALIRTAIGDRSVIAAMRQYNAQLGGEPGGHIIVQPGIASSDGAAAARWLLDTCTQINDYSLTSFIPHVQMQQSIPVSFKPDFTQHPKYHMVTKEIATHLQEGRAIIRYSGTEPLLRIMVEDKSAQTAHHALAILTKTMQTILS